MIRAKEIRFVVFREGDQWVAQGLEFDIGAQARTLQEIRCRIPVLLQCELEESIARYGTPFSGLDVAPRYFYKAWAARSSECMPLHTVNIPDIHVDIALCDYWPVTTYLADLPTFGRYCAWITSAGYGVQKGLFTASGGYAERVTKVTTSPVSRALEVGTLDGDTIAATTIARFDRRLGLQAFFSHPAGINTPFVGAHLLSSA